MTTSDKPTMTAQRFSELAAAYGAEPRRWPEAERAAALEFLAHGGQAVERLLFEARLVDLALDASPAPSVPDALRWAVISASSAIPQRRQGWWSRLVADRPAWLPGVGLATACALGVVVGLQATQVAMRDVITGAVYETAEVLAPEDLEAWG